ncbi:hypothetical protein B1218_34800, partial [Pseudomonas ogarae]
RGSGAGGRRGRGEGEEVREGGRGGGGETDSNGGRGGAGRERAGKAGWWKEIERGEAAGEGGEAGHDGGLGSSGEGGSNGGGGVLDGPAGKEHLAGGPTGGRTENEINQRDTGLRRAMCEQEVAGAVESAARHLGRVTVKVRCDSATPWTVFVPAQVRLFR